MRSCKTCRHWSTKVGPCDPSYEGYCVKNAPTPRILGHYEQKDSVQFVNWPQVRADDYCGEYEIIPGNYPKL